ncbi:MAG: 50S ribosome-binding GTPase [Ancrocorticia sp.]|jgi:GTP-binding protein EngB required for normal cell division|nr:50S ribosome-binding GTPase [Ancrocorticia sp.]MCI1896498.1 50S ribosome-binding GTPase [Ancrocorticia sp.]MCI2012993.1 50S ribosome-binding GTPase [Ancrocorticia sp.]MCI2029730.1 50S ribosome-binding GTPase [Ancrocorticia sp.]MCI2199384.1 50S ribosome-binding GTPase [Ancrocorticia sp.]
MAEEPLPRAGGITQRLERLTSAMEIGGEYFNPFVRARAREALQRAEQRAARGEGVTVAALMGGTGAGKSSLFNLLTGLSFSEVGELRPTTTHPVSCTWHVDADGVLDMIGVPREARITHDSPLVDDDPALHSLVLIDLPDHDSVALGNAALFNRILPLIDVLIWVLDPQKYADQILHEGYLSSLRGRSDQILVVVNQADTLPDSSIDVVVADVKKLLAADGLRNVPVVVTSVPRRAGLEQIHGVLAQAVARDDAAVRSAEAELDSISAMLARELGDGTPDVPQDAADAAAAGFEDAVALDAVSASVKATGLKSAALAKPEKPAGAMTAAIRDAWIAAARTGLPEPWQKALDEAVAPSEKLRKSVNAAVRNVPLQPQPRTPIVVGICLGALAIVGGALWILGELAGWWPRGAAWMPPLVGAIALVFLVLFTWWGVRVHRRRAHRRALDYEAQVRSAINDVVHVEMVAPTERIVERFRRTRAALVPE